ncbi:sulfite exporter TauE/SafE family protein [Marinospirillum sp.]|uniref:sulfite exporter TauE/SafE family protein n=1 Tax=Marinospirillum sp. TaxID=2183934 RepID=UPI00286FB7A3|nr:sulfite exporter TauE/SafE family protein [Marinospirillum sp.]MDR9467039.1 sulfite exporter TauE/SafE family protein [Marinospirillum sp.]
MTLLIYLLLGAGAGLLAGLFGIGGGLVIVPVLVLTFTALGFPAEILVHMAVGTSLATIVPTSISSTWSHHQKGGVSWPWFRLMAPGILLGALLGAWTASLLSGLALQQIIGVFILVVAAKMALNLNPRPGSAEVKPPVMVFAGGVIGWASAIFGIGGGTLSVPFLTWCKAAMHKAVGTSAALGLPIAVFGALGNFWTGWGNPNLPEAAWGYVYWPAFLGIVVTSVPFARLGAKLAHHLPEKLLKKLFALLLLLVGIRFLLA